MMPLDTAPPMMPARSHQGQSNPPTAIGRTATEAVGRHRRFGYAKWGGSEHFSRTARVDPAEARQMVARLAEAAVSVAAKGRAHPSGPSQERNAPREGAPVSIVFQELPMEDWYDPVRRLDKASSTTAYLMLKTRRSSRYQPHIDRAKSERKFVLNHACHRSAVD